MSSPWTLAKDPTQRRAAGGHPLSCGLIHPPQWASAVAASSLSGCSLVLLPLFPDVTLLLIASKEHTALAPAGCHGERVCSSGSGHRSRPTANSTHSVRWPGARELEPILQRTQNSSARDNMLWGTLLQLSPLCHWWVHVCVWAYARENAGSCVQLIVSSVVLRDRFW